MKIAIGGRLGNNNSTHRYHDMDQFIAMSLKDARSL